MQYGEAPAITVEKATLMTLWYLAGQSPMESESDRFGVAPSTVYHELHCIVDILCTLSHKFIVWPKEHECAVVRQQFYEYFIIEQGIQVCILLCVMCVACFRNQSSVLVAISL